MQTESFGVTALGRTEMSQIDGGVPFLVIVGAVVVLWALTPGTAYSP